MRKMIIMRGLPGSGKTTFVRLNLIDSNRYYNCSADAFHMKDGIYDYKPENAGAAHNQCFKDAMRGSTSERGGERDVVIDNTNTRAFEIAPYIALANAQVMDHEIVYVLSDPLVAIARNIHNVPAATILAMHASLVNDPLPSFWKVRVVHPDELEEMRNVAKGLGAKS